MLGDDSYQSVSRTGCLQQAWPIMVGRGCKASLRTHVCIGGVVVVVVWGGIQIRLSKHDCGVAEGFSGRGIKITPCFRAAPCLAYCDLISCR